MFRCFGWCQLANPIPSYICNIARSCREIQATIQRYSAKGELLFMFKFSRSMTQPPFTAFLGKFAGNHGFCFYQYRAYRAHTCSGRIQPLYNLNFAPLSLGGGAVALFLLAYPAMAIASIPIAAITTRNTMGQWLGIQAADPEASASRIGWDDGMGEDLMASLFFPQQRNTEIPSGQRLHNWKITIFFVFF